MEDLRQTSTGKTHSWTEEEISKNTDLSFLSFYHNFIIIIFIFNSDVRCFFQPQQPLRMTVQVKDFTQEHILVQTPH